MSRETCPTLQKCLLQKIGLHGPFVPELSLSCLRVLEVAGGGVEVAGGWLGTGMLEQVPWGPLHASVRQQCLSTELWQTDGAGLQGR